VLGLVRRRGPHNVSCGRGGRSGTAAIFFYLACVGRKTQQISWHREIGNSSRYSNPVNDYAPSVYQATIDQTLGTIQLYYGTELCQDLDQAEVPAMWCPLPRTHREHQAWADEILVTRLLQSGAPTA